MAGQGGQRRPVGTHCQLLNGSLLQAPVLRAFAICMPTGKYVLKCLLSPDMRQLATISSDKTVKLWNVDGFTLDRTLTGGHCFRFYDYLTAGLSSRPYGKG